MQALKEKLDQTVAHIHSIKKCSPKVGVVLGSGLGDFVEKMENKKLNIFISYLLYTK